MRAPRRRLLGALGAGAALLGGAVRGAPDEAPATWREPGGGFSNYGRPREGGPAVRWIANDPSMPGNGASWTPLHELEGTITPNGLHFERHHNGVPDVDGSRWRLAVDGRVRQPLAVDLATLRARPQRSRMAFLECSGNSNALWHDPPRQAPAGWLHGLVSSGEWSGVPLASLLAEAAPERAARWLIATGLDPSGVTVSLALDALPPDTLVALHRNGEPLRAEHGWPARLLVPGHEGIANVKWLGRLTLAERPAMSRFDTVAYTDLLPNGRATRFSRVMGVKSVLTTPSVGEVLPSGAIALSGLAWSGAGAIERVEFSVDGGRRWRETVLEEPVIERSFVRFRAEWRRRAGEGALLQTRARDASGRVQPTRRALLGERGRNGYYHYNAILSAEVAPDGSVSHVHV